MNPTCEYLIHQDGAGGQAEVRPGQRECGDPATQRINSARTMFYCDCHADMVRDNYARLGKRIDIVPIPDAVLAP